MFVSHGLKFSRLGVSHFLGNMLNKAGSRDCSIVDDVIVIQNFRGARHHHFGLEVSTFPWVVVVVVVVVVEMGVMVAFFCVSRHFFPTDHVCTCTWSRSHVCRCYFAKVHGSNSELNFFQETYQCTHTGIYHILTDQVKLPIHACTPSAIFGCFAAMARVFRTSRSNLLVFLVACGCLRLSRVFVATNWRLGCYAECWIWIRNLLQWTWRCTSGVVVDFRSSNLLSPTNNHGFLAKWLPNHAVLANPDRKRCTNATENDWW